MEEENKQEKEQCDHQWVETVDDRSGGWVYRTCSKCGEKGETSRKE